MARQTKFKPVTIIAVAALCIFAAYIISQQLSHKKDEDTTTASASASPSAPLTKDDVREIVKGYINDHPDEIIKSLEALQHKTMEDSQKAAQKSLDSKRSEVEDVISFPFAGNPKGDVKVVEFFDYSCGYCKSANPTISQLLNDDKNITFIYREFPILGPISEVAARYALAVWALDKSKYTEFHNRLMKEHLTKEEEVIAIASSLGIDAEKLKQEALKPEIMSEINKNRELASQIGIRGTPAFIVGGELVPGAIDLSGLKAKIDDARKKPAGAASVTVPTIATPDAKAPDAKGPANPAAPAKPDAASDKDDDEKDKPAPAE